MQDLEDNLTAEIEFWQEMIESRSLTMAPERVERMEQALALATRKLQLMKHAASFEQVKDMPALTPGLMKEH